MLCVMANPIFSGTQLILFSPGPYFVREAIYSASHCFIAHSKVIQINRKCYIFVINNLQNAENAMLRAYVLRTRWASVPN
jgi:hypothetical protein